MTYYATFDEEELNIVKRAMVFYLDSMDALDLSSRGEEAYDKAWDLYIRIRDTNK